MVRAGGQTKEVTATRAAMDGFGDGENGPRLGRAVNEAGESEPATTTVEHHGRARQITLTGNSSTTSRMTVDFTFDDGRRRRHLQALPSTHTGRRSPSPADGSIASVEHCASNRPRPAGRRSRTPAGTRRRTRTRRSRPARTSRHGAPSACSETDTALLRQAEPDGGGADGIAIYGTHDPAAGRGYANTGDASPPSATRTGDNVNPRGKDVRRLSRLPPRQDASRTSGSRSSTVEAMTHTSRSSGINIDGDGQELDRCLPAC